MTTPDAKRPARSPLGFGECALLILLAILAIATLFVQPTACVWLLSPFVGVVVLIILWGWRFPRRRLRLGRLAKEAEASARRHVPVLKSKWTGALRHAQIRVVVATDAERERLLADRFEVEFDRLRDGLKLPWHEVSLNLLSEESVLREHGSWYGYEHYELH